MVPSSSYVTNPHTATPEDLRCVIDAYHTRARKYTRCAELLGLQRAAARELIISLGYNWCVLGEIFKMHLALLIRQGVYYVGDSQ